METYTLTITTVGDIKYVFKKMEFKEMSDRMLHFYAYPDIYGNIKKAIISLDK